MFEKAQEDTARCETPGMEISYSRINAYKTCPWKYKLLYEEGRHLPPNPFISLGLSIHRTLEDYHLRKVEGFDELMESYNKCWVNEGFVSPTQVQDFYEKGQRMLENYHASSSETNTEIVYVEKEFFFQIQGQRMRGIIDRIDRLPDGGYELIEYKTHLEVWNPVRVETDLQMSLYSLACREALGFVPQVLSYYFLAHNRKVTTQRSEEQIAESVDLVLDVADKIMRKEYPANHGHCPRCDFRNNCHYSVAARHKEWRKGRAR